LPNLYGETGECPTWHYRPRHAAPPMMMRLLRRTGWALARAERGYADEPGGSTPARDVILGMQVRWLEVVGRETTAAAVRRPRLSQISTMPAPAISHRAW
jgi:hypothetical protein